MARARLIRAPWFISRYALGTSCTPRSSEASFSARRLTPRSSGVPTAYHQRPAVGTRYIFATRALAAYRCPPLSSYVRRQPNPALVRAREPPPIQSPWRPGCTGARMSRRASAAVAAISGCAVHSGGAHWRPTARAGLIRALRVVTCNLLGTFCTPRSPGASFSARRLTPRSSGAPTAAHQARSVVPEHSPQPGPGVLPLSPA